MGASTNNALSAEFLYELYALALRYEPVCGMVALHMKREYLPDRAFQLIQEVLANHYGSYKVPPSYPVLSQAFAEDYEAIELINTFRECDTEHSTEAVTDMFEAYIKGVRLQAVYIEVGNLYNQSRQDKAQEKLKEYAEWLNGFTLKSSQFVDVGKTFSQRFQKNRFKEKERTGLSEVIRFYLPDLDELNNGRSLRGQLTCFLASTGVGKSHIAKHIGVQANVADGLHILHFQLEGSEEEALNAYSGGLISKNAFYFEKGKISDTEMRVLQDLVRQLAGTITTKPRKYGGRSRWRVSTRSTAYMLRPTP